MIRLVRFWYSFPLDHSPSHLNLDTVSFSRTNTRVHSWKWRSHTYFLSSPFDSQEKTESKSSPGDTFVHYWHLRKCLGSSTTLYNTNTDTSLLTTGLTGSEFVISHPERVTCLVFWLDQSLSVNRLQCVSLPPDRRTKRFKGEVTTKGGESLINLLIIMD